MWGHSLNLVLKKRLLSVIALLFLLPIWVCVDTIRSRTPADTPLSSTVTDPVATGASPGVQRDHPTIHLVKDGARQEISNTTHLATTRNAQFELVISGDANLSEVPTVRGGSGVRLGPSTPTTDGSYRRPVQVTFQGSAELSIATINGQGVQSEQTITFREPTQSGAAPTPRPASGVK